MASITFYVIRGLIMVFRRFQKIAKSNYLFRYVCLSVSPSVLPHGTTRLSLDEYSWNLICEDFFENLSRKFKFSLKSDKNKGYFTWRSIKILSYLAQFFLEWEMFQTKVVEKIKTHILGSVTVFRKLCRLWDNVEKYCTVGRATDDDMAHGHCMLDT
jgi:hypothetical protein